MDEVLKVTLLIIGSVGTSGAIIFGLQKMWFYNSGFLLIINNNIPKLGSSSEDKKEKMKSSYENCLHAMRLGSGHENSKQRYSNTFAKLA